MRPFKTACTLVALGLLAIGVAYAEEPKGIETLDEARQVEKLPRLPSRNVTIEHDSEEASSSSAVSRGETDSDGKLKAAGGRLTVWNNGRWYWNFFSYLSDSWAWVTDQNGNRFRVDKIEAHLTHASCYGDNTDVKTNSDSAHGHVRNTGVAVCKSGICTWSCAEHRGYGRWCTQRKCY